MQCKFLTCVVVGILLPTCILSDDGKFAINVDYDFDNCPGKIHCNDGMDKVCGELRTFIKSVSPIKEKGIPLCHELIATGSYTMTRDGDVYSCPLNDTKGCSIQKVDFRFDFLNFTCFCSADQIKEVALKVANGGDITKLFKRALLKPPALKPPTIPKPEGYIDGHWTPVRIAGRMQLCKEDNTKNVAEGMRIKEWSPEGMTISCHGDPALNMFCEGEYKQKVKEAIGAAIQPVMSRCVQNAMMNGPADIARKFSCDYAATKN